MLRLTQVKQAARSRCRGEVWIFLSISYLMLPVEGSLGFLGPGLERIGLLIGPLGVEHEPFVP